MALHWIRRADRYFADGARGTYRALPLPEGWRVDFQVDGYDWTEIGTGDSSAEVKRHAQEWDARPVGVY